MSMKCINLGIMSELFYATHSNYFFHQKENGGLMSFVNEVIAHLIEKI